MNKAKHYCDNINCNHNDTKGLCCLFNPENCKYRQLQKENAELKEENAELKKTYRKQRNKRIDELQKENAELKEALKNGKVCKCSHYLNFKDLEAELTKAKEIIKKLISDNRKVWVYSDVREEAEQFLNSEVEK